MPDKKIRVAQMNVGLDTNAARAKSIEERNVAPMTVT